MASFHLLLLTVLFSKLQEHEANKLERSTKKILSKKYSWELDTKAMLAQSTFSSIKPDRLIEICKEVIDRNIGLDNPDDLADDFFFQFPIIGPLSKAQYLEAVGGFKIKEMFPDLNNGMYGFHVDPFEPNRVWFITCFTATNTGDGVFGKATNKHVVCPPQALSLSFNEKGQVIKYTGGYVLDKLIGNTGGMGGIFGPLYAIGKPFPFPEARPYKKSWQFKLFIFFGAVLTKLSKIFNARN